MKISLVTATYNCVATLADCLASVTAQRHADIEHVVIDGNSHDGTLAMLEQNRRKLAKLVSEPDHGIYDALNKGLRLCTGEVIGFLHADDLFADERVLDRVAAVFSNPEVDACYGDLAYVYGHDTRRIVRYWRAGAFSRARLARGWMPPHPTFYVRRKVYEQLGGFDTSLRIAADYDSMLRVLLARGERVAYIPDLLVRMRVGGISNRGIGNIIRKSREDLVVIRRHQLGGIGTLLCKNLSKLNQFVVRPPKLAPEK